MTTTFEERKAEIERKQAELKEAQENLAKLERENREQERKLAAAREQVEADKKRLLAVEAWYQKSLELVAELRKAGFTKATSTKASKESGSTLYPRIDLGVDELPNDYDYKIAFDTVYSAHSWHSHANGARIEVGRSYGGNAHRFPQKADGSFSYAKIAKCAWEQYQTALSANKAAIERRKKTNTTQQKIDAINRKYGSPRINSWTKQTTYEIEGINLEVSGYHGGERIAIEVNNRSLTAEDAEKLVAAIVATGVLKTTK